MSVDKKSMTVQINNKRNIPLQYAYYGSTYAAAANSLPVSNMASQSYQKIMMQKKLGKSEPTLDTFQSQNTVNSTTASSSSTSSRSSTENNEYDSDIDNETDAPTVSVKVSTISQFESNSAEEEKLSEDFDDGLPAENIDDDIFGFQEHDLKTTPGL
jgi:hypothetical protein